MANVNTTNLPVLKGQKNFKKQQNTILNALKVADLERYILKDVKEPENNTLKAQKTWKNKKATAKKVFVAFITDNNVIRLLKRNSQDYLKKNPKVTYDLIKRYIPQVNTASPINLLAEIIYKKRKQFNTFSTYINHIIRIKD